MIKIINTILLATFFAGIAFAQQNVGFQQQIIELSSQKWQWMADKNVDELAKLFHDKSKFVHMSGTWKKDEELDIIKTKQ